MRRRVLLLFLLIPFLLFLGTTGILAQNPWDSVLDRYEDICARCIDLRQRISAGESVQDRSVTSLLQELGELRKTLQDASGAMTPKQKSRFRGIQLRYAAASGESVAAPTKPAPAPPAKAKTTVRREPEPPAATMPRDTVPLPPGSLLYSGKVSALQEDDPSPRLSHTEALFPESTQEYPGEAVSFNPPVQQRRFIDVLAIYGHGTASSFGLMAAGGIGHWGIWIAGRSNFTPTGALYDCTSTGRTASGKFWGNGRSRFGVWSVSGGPLWAPLPWLSIYAGFGYSREELDWQDALGEWARVKDYSLAGVAGDAGVLLHWRHLSFSLGCSWSHYATLTAGIGVHF